MTDEDAQAIDLLLSEATELAAALALTVQEAGDDPRAPEIPAAPVAWVTPDQIAKLDGQLARSIM